MKAVIFARVSSKEQEDGHSLDAQLANLRVYAERNNLDIVKEFTVIESSTKGDRPEFMRMIEFIKQQGDKVALVVDTVDRLQRSFKEKPLLDELLQADVLELHFVKEGNILTKESNSTQKLMWNMGVVMSQSYTDSLSDNVKRSVKHKISNGEWSGPAPLGYLNVDDALTGKKTIVLDTERAFLIRKFFEHYALGTYSLAELTRKLKGWGLRTRKGNTVSNQTMHDLIQNPFYHGVMRVKGQLHRHRYEPLVTKELYDACNAVRVGKGRNQAVVDTKHPFLFRGMLKCAASGRQVTCDLKKKKHVYLITRDPLHSEKKLWVKEDVVLVQVRDVFKSIQIPEPILAEVVDSLRKTHESEKNVSCSVYQSA